MGEIARRHASTTQPEEGSSEAALRELFHRLASATELSDLARKAVDAAREATASSGAYIGRVVAGDAGVEVIASNGEGAPPIGARADIPSPPPLDELVDESHIVLPLRAGSEVFGALGLVRSHRAGPFLEPEIDRASTVADAIAIAMQRVHTLEREREARAQLTRTLESISDHKIAELALRRSERRQTILADTGQLLEATLGFHSTLERLAHLLVRWLCDWCVIYVPAPGGARRAVLAGRDPETEMLARRAVGGIHPESAETATIRVLRTGRSVLLPEIPEGMLESAAAQDSEYGRLLREHRPESIVNVPLVARGHTIAAVGLISTSSERRFTEDDLSLAEEIARRAALALDSAKLYEDAMRRALAESALRKAAASVTAQLTVDPVIQEVARNALVALDAVGAFVERVDEATGMAIVIATAGEHAPPNGASTPYEGSFAKHVVEHGQPERIRDLGEPGRLVPRVLTTRCRGCPALVVPLLREQARGALFFVRGPGTAEFGEDEAERGAIFGELAGLAFRKAYLLELAERRQADAEAAIRARDEVLAVVSHDLRNPLHTIGMATSILDDEGMALDAPGRRQQYAVIKRSTERMNRLIEDLLDVSRIEAGRFTVKRECQNPIRIVQEAFVTFRPIAENRHLSLRQEVHDTPRPVFVDRDRIMQVLANFLDNAFKFSSVPSEVVIGLEPDDGTGIRFSVRDRGPGIGPEAIPHVFDRFWQGKQTAHKGAGLGLAIAKGIAEVHEGRVWAESTVGEGSTFYLALPYSPQCT